MKLKHFTAPNTTLAMSQIRAELGNEAIIISTETVSEGVQVTAAIEENQNINFDNKDNLEVVPSLQVYDDVKIRESLEYHDALPDVAGQILAVSRLAYSKDEKADNRDILAAALQQMCRFSPLLEGAEKNKIFLGAPGCGKSTVIAKAATQAKLKGIKACIISTDNVRAGANRQLEAFAGILDIDFYFCKSARDLFSVVQKGKDKYELLLIDTPGINPYISEQVQMIDTLLDSVRADRILVQDAGRNTLEAVETAEIFTQLGAEFLLPTRLDMTRRIGAILSAAYCNRLAFCAGSVSADIAKGLSEITPLALAKLLLSD